MAEIKYIIYFSGVYDHLKVRIVFLLPLNEPLISTGGAGPPPMSLPFALPCSYSSPEQTKKQQQQQHWF